MKIDIGSLEIVEVFNGYMLYGYLLPDGDITESGDHCIAHLGDGVEAFFLTPGYDPNDDPDLPEAYGFELV
jgi:hypothetical protein